MPRELVTFLPSPSNRTDAKVFVLKCCKALVKGRAAAPPLCRDDYGLNLRYLER